MLTWIAGQSSAYDYASACARPYRAHRARALPDAPCDLSKHNFCTTPGSNYPWHAIRRFVRENQGLMRRMYGEERHISVLKAELENFIEDDDEHDAKKPTGFAEDIIKTKIMYMKGSQGRAMRDKPHFRPIQFVHKNKKVDNDTLKVKPLENTTLTKLNKTENRNNNTQITRNDTVNEDKGISYKTRLESIANIEIDNLEPDVITLEAVIKQSIETNSIYNTATVKNDVTKVKNDTVVEKNITATEKVANITETTVEDIYDDTTTELDKEGLKSVGDTTLPPTLLFSEHEKINIDRIDTKINEKKEEFRPKPTQHQEPARPSIKLQGANACESKEEMSAPFWANNTRGEVLALLNMYPFEQYIHLETCVHEKKQMYCREGCRCEQQYRLHRLLAYDPGNECRGIFADWFKFPACCVCKCYDVPLELRARSPRLRRPQYGEDVRRAIYEDVARDWYAMSAFGDYDDDFY
ncbi:protein spaetzle 4 isoform X2 [Plodia interpunctella]|uniref:protein spaetzle 4 isoform X2 n=1 Tax=Plodia interpunctella TaxID=58824 RepID=UPI002367A7F6|nr:protein spaetzle 4 isoform X2 [Plodia interpunctella]